MDKSILMKEIRTLHSLVKATRIQMIRKLIRDHKGWAARAKANSSNLRAKRKAETIETILNHIKSIRSSVLVEEVIRYQPLQNGESSESAPLAHRSMARLLQDAKLNRHLKSLESQFGAGASSKLLEVFQNRRIIKSSVAKKQRKERIVKLLEKKKKKAEKKAKRTTPLKKKAGKTEKAKTEQPNIGHETDEEEHQTTAVCEKKAGKTEKAKTEQPNIDHETDEEENQTTAVCDSYESDDDAEELDMERDDSDKSDGGVEPDQHRKLNISVCEDGNNSSDEESIDHRLEELPHVKHNSMAERNDPPRMSKPYNKKFDQTDRQNVQLPKKKRSVNYKAPEEEDEKDGYEMITDSFFVTDTGARYVAVAPKFKPQVNDVMEEDVNKESWKLINRKKRRDQQWEEADNNEAFQTDSKRPKQRKMGMNHFTNGRSAAHSSDKSSIKNEDLHPSWAAKQAQKGIKPFAGKKVVFDAEDNSGSAPSYPQQSSGKYNAKNDDLHPSWAAKQAQKGIKPFAGKKVVFDAEDNSGSVPSYPQQSSGKYNAKNDDLHPSWAAKQAQKGIKPFAGKKIVFGAEDDSGSFSPVKPFAGKNISSGVAYTNGADATSSKKPFVTNNRTSDLHPSWAAKQAQSGIKSFAGKKTVFDDEESGNADVKTNGTINVAPKSIPKHDRHLSGAAKQATSKAQSTDLHPSWAAKQARKAIPPFTGKKVVFDNEQTAREKATTAGVRGSYGGPKSQPNNTPSDLHPSWAAKQAQSGIKPFAGTKISFDD
uniref:Serum response factor-binding protein 1 n=1 Tax=Anopheles minimus TaxID=112268 RepID=A0A182W1D9_9DIPT